jgi:4-hydroxybenzoate polyprenyltransferase
VVCAAALGRATLWLSPVALAVLWGYSLTKRFTALCHLVLGIALGLAPVATWIALTDGVTATPVCMGLGVLTWVAGFDILYATQDAAYDRSVGLHSIPARLGIGPALSVARALHVATVACFAAVAWTFPLGPVYGVGVLLLAAILWAEHRMVRADDLSRLDQAFFEMNGYVALGYLATIALS